jgi:hypothetical protein
MKMLREFIKNNKEWFNSIDFFLYSKYNKHRIWVLR